MKKIINNLDQFADVATSVGKTLQSGDIIFLNGEMGVGKTTFVSYIGQYFDYNDVSSPSYTLVNHYPTRIPIIHMDFYRCNNEKEIQLLDLEHYFQKKDHIIIIEWAQKSQTIQQWATKIIELTMTGKNKRIISLTDLKK